MNNWQLNGSHWPVSNRKFNLKLIPIPCCKAMFKHRWSRYYPFLLSFIQSFRFVHTLYCMLLLVFKKTVIKLLTLLRVLRIYNMKQELRYLHFNKQEMQCKRPFKFPILLSNTLMYSRMQYKHCIIFISTFKCNLCKY